MAQSRVFPAIKRLSSEVLESGKGSRVFTREGASYLDFTSGIGVTSTGHCHPTVVAAVCAQAAKITHAQQSVAYSGPMLNLIDKLLPVMPRAAGASNSQLRSFIFSNSGGEAVENALRLARHATGKSNIIAFSGGYHGRTAGALAVTSSSIGYRGPNGPGPLPYGSFFAPYPYEHLGPHRSPSVVMEELDLMLKTQSPQAETAAVLIEPVLGEGGYVPAPVSFMQELREWCTKNEILLIADEVQSGFGRTGKMFAVEHSGVEPDVLVVAKGMASGYPIAATVTRDDISAKQGQSTGCMGGTYGGNAVSCAAAMATMDVFENEGVVVNTVERGEQLQNGLRQIASSVNQSGDKVIEDVRGLGLMIGCEFNISLTGLSARISQLCHDRNMLLLPTGVRETIRFVPPLVVKEDEVEECLDIFNSSLQQALSER
jgi:4-aminobutyrate aminotransferase